MAQLKVSLENIIPLTEARDHFSQIVTDVQQDKLYILTKGGKPAVAIIDVKYLEAITGGAVKQEHIENEIQKDPLKVGRTPMISHADKKEDDDEIFASPFKSPFTQTAPPAPNTPPLVFPKVDDKPAMPTPPAPTNIPQPIKINFQPDNNPKPATPTPMPITPPSVTPPPAPQPIAAPTPPTPMTPPPAPISTPNNVITTTTSPLTAPAAPTMPTPPPPPITPPAPAPTSPPPVNTAAPINANNTNAMIDVIPMSGGSPAVNSSLISPDDKPGPAQYAGGSATTNSNEPEDMEI